LHTFGSSRRVPPSAFAGLPISVVSYLFEN
jgi:hypothetical protein